jgi:hypothetical protein
MASHFLYYSFKNAGYDLVELQKTMAFQSLQEIHFSKRGDLLSRKAGM